MWGLWKLKQLFTAFGKCQFYTASTIGYMKGFALALVASSVLQTVIHPAIALITSMESPDGLRIGIGISSAQLTQASLGVLLLVIAWVMDEGREIVEENRQFV